MRASVLFAVLAPAALAAAQDTSYTSTSTSTSTITKTLSEVTGSTTTTLPLTGTPSTMNSAPFYPNATLPSAGTKLPYPESNATVTTPTIAPTGSASASAKPFAGAAAATLQKPAAAGLLGGALVLLAMVL
ncbi:MAG: hypothetical protein M1832_006289 [Thelocarpon impressellum]|nr:MAG: hypothetical protein M1832_006289 [Thelocarpon impressellum]